MEGIEYQARDLGLDHAGNWAPEGSKQREKSQGFIA